MFHSKIELIMKKNILFSIVTLSFLAFTSCDDKLDITNPTTLSVDQFITDAESAKTALFDAYSEMQDRYVAGSDPKMFTGLYADELRHSGSFPSFTQAVVNNVLVNNSSVSRIFSNHYDIINRCTTILRTIESVEMDASAKEAIIAEAHALRAFGYFQLVKLYGGLPIVEKVFTLDGVSANSTPRSTEAEVFTYILNEISKAKGKIAASNNYTTFTNDAVSVLEAQVHMFMGNYNLAEPILKGIIDNGGYSLVPYANLFTNGDNNSAIFRVNYNSSDKNSLAFFFTPTGRKEVAPTQELLDAFETGDLRKDLIANNTSLADAFINKYTDNATGSDQPYVYRYADVLLMYAEVLARKDDATAKDYLNQVRTRAGLADVTDLNSTNFAAIISQERLVEFYAEGKRWEDAKRLGFSETIINAKTGVTFIDRQLLWPIPQDELDANPSISQEDQNPGY